jgi:hypothetical protein
MNYVLLILAFAFSLVGTAQAQDRALQMPDDARMSYIENDEIKVGVDLNHGGAIVYLSREGGANLINNYDLGRQVQLSFFSGPVPYSVPGQEPAEHWRHIGWNPIQTGDDFKTPSRVLAHRNDGKTLYVKCQPMQWPLNNVPGDCTFESWLELAGAVVVARARLNNTRSDRKQYDARLQELPAVYANAAFHRVVSYTGSRPFAGEPVSEVLKPVGKHPWSFWHGTESWCALLDERDFGVGLVTPGRIYFTGGFAGEPGKNDTFGNATGYLAGQGLEVLDHNISYEFRYELVAGDLKEIRERAALHQPRSLPRWDFTQDRQGWHFINANDNGWPIKGHLHVLLGENDPQLISPFALWQGQDAPFLILEAAFSTPHRNATVFWQHHGKPAPGKNDHMVFPIKPDGKFHRYVIRLADSPSYQGPVIGLRFDPVPSGQAGDWLKVKSIRLTRTDAEQAPAGDVLKAAPEE